MLAPIHIEYAIAFYITTNPIRHLGQDRTSSEAGKEAINWLRTTGLIDAGLMPTDKLEAWIKMLCDTPLPVKQWVRPNPEAEVSDG